MADFDFQSLEEKLKDSLEKDRVYKLQNEAKLRAVGSNPVKTYDEFRAIVDTAHLKPIEKKDRIRGNEIRVVWNSSATNDPDEVFVRYLRREEKWIGSRKKEDQSFLSSLPHRDPPALLEALRTMSRAPRFKLDMMMLTDKERSRLATLFQSLPVDTEDLQSLKELYFAP